MQTKNTKVVSSNPTNDEVYLIQHWHTDFKQP